MIDSVWSPSTGGDSSSSSSGLSMSDRIAIGVGLGIGIPSIVIAFVAYLWPRDKKSRATTSDSASTGSAVLPTAKTNHHKSIKQEHTTKAAYCGCKNHVGN